MDVRMPDGVIIRGVPDGYSQSELLRRYMGNPAPAEAPPKQEPSFMQNVAGVYAEPAMAMASGMVAKPLSDVAGLAAMVGHATGLTQTEPAAVKDAVQRGMTYQPRTDAGKAMTEYNPLALLAKGVDWLGGKAEGAVAGSGASPLRNALASGAHEAVNQAPAFLGLKGGPVVANALSDAAKSGATRMMNSALKPGVVADRKGQAAPAVQTMLDEGLSVSRGGLAKMRDKIGTLNDQIKDAISDSTATVSKHDVGYRLGDTLTKFEKQVAPTADRNAILGTWDDFLQTYPDRIPVKTAQEVKQGTYQALGEKSYGELKSASVEAQKTLARGLKEEIANAVPEVRQLNAQESKLLQALPLLERRVLTEANKNPAGLSLLAKDPTGFVAFMADRSALFKSLVARMLNQTSKALPRTSGSLAATGFASQPNVALPSRKALTGLLMPREDDLMLPQRLPAGLLEYR